ncbi:hypothetical protein C8R47DRAFT_1084488 [Mycena vitilis]|nr:hypothetical protein C8R47DRAFT_1084488 [Mycena vitilis]
MSSSASELDRSIQTFFACIRLLDPSLGLTLDEDGLWTGYIWVKTLNKFGFNFQDITARTGPTRTSTTSRKSTILDIYHQLSLHLETVEKVSTFFFEVPELTEIIELNKGIEGKTAVVHMNSLVLFVLLGKRNRPILEKLSLPDREHLQHMLTEIGASKYADSVAEDLQQHYYDLRRQTYLVIKTMQKLATQRDSAKDQLNDVNDHLHKAEKDMDWLQEQLELQETQLKDLQSDKEAAEKTMQVLNLSRAQKDLAADGQSEGKKNTEKLYENQTVISELELKLKNEQQENKSHKRQLQEKQQKITGLQKEITVTASVQHFENLLADFWLADQKLEGKSADLLNLEMALTQEKETNTRTTLSLQHTRNIQETQARKMVDDGKAFDALNLELAESKGVLAQTQRELTESLQVIKTKNNELYGLREELANTEVPDQSSLADQTTISDLQRKNSDLHNVIMSLREESSRWQEALASERSYCSETILPNFCIAWKATAIIFKSVFEKLMLLLLAWKTSGITSFSVSVPVEHQGHFAQLSENEELVSTTRKLKEANEGMKTAQEELQQQIASQLSQIEAKGSELSNLQSQHEELQEQIRANESQLKDLQTQNVLASERSHWLETVLPNFCIVLAMKCHLQKRLQKAHAYAASLEDLRNHLVLSICALSFRNSWFQARLRHVHNHITKLNTKVIAQLSENEELVSTTRKLKEANEGMKTAQEELQQQIASQLSQIEAKGSELSNLQSQHEELQEQIRANKSQLKDLQTQNVLASERSHWLETVLPNFCIGSLMAMA